MQGITLDSEEFSYAGTSIDDLLQVDLVPASYARF